MTTLGMLAADLLRAPQQLVHRGRGVTATHVDKAAATAKADALASWTAYGRGEAGSAGTIRGRMSADRSEVVGYLLADGDGAFQSEHGTSTRAPDPVMSRAAEAVADGWADALGELGEDILS